MRRPIGHPNDRLDRGIDVDDRLIKLHHLRRFRKLVRKFIGFHFAVKCLSQPILNNVRVITRVTVKRVTH